MKIFKKLNRGVIVFSILILSIIIFSVAQHQRDQQLRPEIEKNLNTFYSDADDLIVLEKIHGDFDLESNYENIDTLANEIWEDQLSGELSMNAFLSDNDRLRSHSNFWLRHAIDTQIWSDSRIVESETTILGIESFSVYQGAVTIEVSIRWAYEVMQSDGETESFNSVHHERLIFEKEGDRWILSSYNPDRFYSLYNSQSYYW